MTFTFTQATREKTPLLIGLIGPSGSGKTFSALRLATGIQRVIGGNIAVIDTEARRALTYANRFKFIHCEFHDPFTPDRYLDAMKAAIDAGAKTIIVDSMSHEHEGPGGVLEWHESELDRMAGDDYRKREAMNFIAWAKPKASRRRMINGFLQLEANFIFCFRAKEKMKMVRGADGKNKPMDAGWQAIGSEEMFYEMPDRFLLLPGCDGVPSFTEESRQTGVPRLHEEHRSMIGQGALDEELGEKLAVWSGGSTQPKKKEKPFNLNQVLNAFAEIGVSTEQIQEYLGHPPTKDDRQALSNWFRELKDSFDRDGRAGGHSDQPSEVESETVSMDSDEEI